MNGEYLTVLGHHWLDEGYLIYLKNLQLCRRDMTNTNRGFWNKGSHAIMIFCVHETTPALGLLCGNPALARDSHHPRGSSTFGIGAPSWLGGGATENISCGSVGSWLSRLCRFCTSLCSVCTSPCNLARTYGRSAAVLVVLLAAGAAGGVLSNMAALAVTKWLYRPAAAKHVIINLCIMCFLKPAASP